MEELKNMNSVRNPATKYFFTVNPNEKNMDVEKTDAFHTAIAKYLFLYQRERLDIKQTVPLLCTRVKIPDKYDR